MITAHALTTLPALFEEVESGRLATASYKEHFTWGWTDVQDFLKSMLSGMHLGTLIIYKPDASADVSTMVKSQLGPIVQMPSKASRVLMEGYCRMAIYGWIRNTNPNAIAPTEGEQKLWKGDQELVFDYGAKGLIFVPKAEAAKGLRLPAWTVTTTRLSIAERQANSIISARKKNEWSGLERREIDDFVHLHDQARSMVQDAAITVTTISHCTPVEARRACRVASTPMLRITPDS